MPETQWSHFPHSADIGVRGIGRTPSAAFEQAACALFAAVTDLRTIAAIDVVEIHCQAPSIKLLLVDWLNALIYEAETRRMLFSRFSVDITGPRLYGRAWGEPIDPAKHAPAVGPKGATFTELRVDRRDDDTWIAQCVVDV